MPASLFIISIVLLLLAFAWWKRNFYYVIVYDYQTGLRYRKGKLIGAVPGGRYMLFRPWDNLVGYDMREAVASIVNQEVICADNLAVRLSSAVVYKIEDAVKTSQSARNYTEILYLEAQLAMREVVSGLKTEEILSKRNELSQTFLAALSERSAELGLKIQSGGIRDITFPAEVRKIFLQVAQAEKAAEATLAKSRAETASLRALANAAKMMEDNPNLLTLRTLQSVSELAANSGNTIVMGLPSNMVPVQTKPNGGKKPPADET